MGERIYERCVQAPRERDPCKTALLQYVSESGERGRLHARGASASRTQNGGISADRAGNNVLLISLTSLRRLVI